MTHPNDTDEDDLWFADFQEEFNRTFALADEERRAWKAIWAEWVRHLAELRAKYPPRAKGTHLTEIEELTPPATRRPDDGSFAVCEGSADGPVSLVMDRYDPLYPLFAVMNLHFARRAGAQIVAHDGSDPYRGIVNALEETAPGICAKLDPNTTYRGFRPDGRGLFVDEFERAIFDLPLHELVYAVKSCVSEWRAKRIATCLKSAYDMVCSEHRGLIAAGVRAAEEEKRRARKELRHPAPTPESEALLATNFYVWWAAHVLTSPDAEERLRDMFHPDWRHCKAA